MAADCKLARVGTWPPTVFPGTAEERDALLAALRQACTCQRNRERTMLVCGAHALLLDERAVKHLIFYRRCRAALWPDEALTV
jgi:hypothetical protein